MTDLPEPFGELPFDADLQPFEAETSPGDPPGTVPIFDQDLAETQEEFIAQTLDWCAELFGASRARFIRPLESGGWLVYTRQKEKILTHLADFAEIAMAWTVGLSRQPLEVSRPRIAHLDGSGLRPIALKSYLGIPIVCQDRLVGVIEFAGDNRRDIEATLVAASPRLANVGERLLFDPGLHRRPSLTPDSSLVLAGAVWSRGDVVLTAEELRLLSVINGRMTVSKIASEAGIDPERALELAGDLLERGLVEAG